MINQKMIMLIERKIIIQMNHNDSLIFNDNGFSIDNDHKKITII